MIIKKINGRTKHPSTDQNRTALLIIVTTKVQLAFTQSDLAEAGVDGVA